MFYFLVVHSFFKMGELQHWILMVHPLLTLGVTPSQSNINNRSICGVQCKAQITVACIVYLKFWRWRSLQLWSRWYIRNSPSLTTEIVCIACTACRQPISCEWFMLKETSIAADTTPSKTVISSHAIGHSVHLSTSTLSNGRSDTGRQAVLHATAARRHNILKII